MGLNDYIESMTPAFLDTEDVGVAITMELWPGGDSSKSEEIDAILDETYLPGSNEVEGDGFTQNRESAKSSRETAKIDVALNVNIQDEQGGIRTDKVRFFCKVSEKWRVYTVKRKIGADVGLKSFLIVRHKVKLRHKSVRKG